MNSRPAAISNRHWANLPQIGRRMFCTKKLISPRMNADDTDYKVKMVLFELF